jgi:type II secretory pathway component PulF
MSEAFVIGLSTFYWLTAMVNVLICWRRPDLWEVWDFCFGPVYAISSFLLAVSAVIVQNWTGAVVFSVCTVFGGWSWWHNDRHRRKRKKLLEKGAGRVVDLGGRLGVVRPHPNH